jgi:hypothetical protein
VHACHGLGRLWVKRVLIQISEDLVWNFDNEVRSFVSKKIINVSFRNRNSKRYSGFYLRDLNVVFRISLLL